MRWLSSLLRRGRARRLPLRDWLSGAYEPLARWRVERGLRWLSSASVVVTDRLHGHVLSLLGGTPHVLLDDRSGKIRSFYEAWTKGSPGVRWAEAPAEALAEARRLLDAPAPQGDPA